MRRGLDNVWRWMWRVVGGRGSKRAGRGAVLTLDSDGVRCVEVADSMDDLGDQIFCISHLASRNHRPSRLLDFSVVRGELRDARCEVRGARCKVRSKLATPDNLRNVRN